MSDPNLLLNGAAGKQPALQPHSPLRSMIHKVEERAKYVAAGAKAGESQGQQEQRSSDMKYLYIGVAALAAWYFLMQ